VAPLAWRLAGKQRAGLVQIFMGTGDAQCESSPAQPERTEWLRAAVDGARRALARCGHGTVHGVNACRWPGLTWADDFANFPVEKIEGDVTLEGDEI